MKRSTLLLGSLLSFAAGTAMTQSASAPSPAGEAPVAQIIVLDVGPTPSVTVPKVISVMKKANAIARKTGNHGKARLWNMTFAGPDSGRFVIVVETPSMSLMSTDSVKMRADPEWQKIIADIEASGVKVVSESLLTEVRF